MTYPFIKCNRCTIEVWEWMDNFIPHFLIDLITYRLIKRAQGRTDGFILAGHKKYHIIFP